MIQTDKRIEFIELFEVGPFDHTRIEFPTNTNPDLAEVHIFTGSNGCGKTTLLYALASTFEPPHETQVLKRFRGKNSLLAHKKFGDLYLMGWDLQQSNNVRVNERQLDFVYLREGYPNIAGTNYPWHDMNQKFNRGNAWKDIQFPILPLAYSGQRLQQRTSDNLAIQEIKNSPLENHLGFGKAINPQLIPQWIANVLAKESFALSRDHNEKKAQQIRSTLDRVIQAIREIAEDDHFDFTLNTTTLDVAVKWRGIEQPMDLLPDGLKSIISWLTDVLMRMDRLQWEEDRPVTDQPLILFLDEVDIHLHPKWQRKILPVIQKLFRNAQIFVSTHSPFVVGSVKDAWVYTLETPGETAPAQSHVTSPAAPATSSDNEPYRISSTQLKHVQARPSGAGTSYEVLLEEIFEVSEHYDVDSQKLLKQMKEQRNLLLSTPEATTDKFIEIATELAGRSEELDGIVALELRQLAKHGRSITLPPPPSLG